MGGAHPRKVAVGYVRVSTTRQAGEGVSLAAQRAKIGGYCELHGLRLDAVEADEGLSGRAAANRPGLQAALSRVERAGGVLVVYSLSRLARSTRDCIGIADRLGGSGANLASISEQIDTRTGIGRFFFTLMAALAQLESDQTGERIRDALAYKRREMLRYGARAPYGYRFSRDKTRLHVDRREQKVLAEMRRRRQIGWGYRRIATWLNGRGTPAKRGGRWYDASVRAVLMWSRRVGH